MTPAQDHTRYWPRLACLVFFRLEGGGVSFRGVVCALKKAGVLGGGDKGWLETDVKDFAITSFVPQGNEEPQETRVAGPGIVHRRQVPCGFPGVRDAEKWHSKPSWVGQGCCQDHYRALHGNPGVPQAFPLHEVCRSRG